MESLVSIYKISNSDELQHSLLLINPKSIRLSCAFSQPTIALEVAQFSTREYSSAEFFPLQLKIDCEFDTRNSPLITHSIMKNFIFFLPIKMNDNKMKIAVFGLVEQSFCV